MSCETLNNAWDSTLDNEVVYTGYKIEFTDLSIIPNMNLKAIIGLLVQGINNVDQKVYIPSYINDDTLTMDMTGTQLNAKFPNSLVGDTVFSDEGFEYVKITGTKWKFQIIDIR